MRSYQHYSTGSHQNSKVKRAWARVVLGWVTSWEVLVLHPSFCRFSDPIQSNDFFLTKEKHSYVGLAEIFLLIYYTRESEIRAHSYDDLKSKREGRCKKW